MFKRGCRNASKLMDIEVGNCRVHVSRLTVPKWIASTINNERQKESVYDLTAETKSLGC